MSLSSSAESWGMCCGLEVKPRSVYPNLEIDVL